MNIFETPDDCIDICAEIRTKNTIRRCNYDDGSPYFFFYLTWIYILCRPAYYHIITCSSRLPKIFHIVIYIRVTMYENEQ